MTSIFENTIDANLLADIMSVSKSILLRWEASGRIKPLVIDGRKQYKLDELKEFKEIRDMLSLRWDSEIQIKPIKGIFIYRTFRWSRWVSYRVGASWIQGHCFK